MKKTNILIVGAFSAVVIISVLTIYIYTASQTSDIEKLGTFFGGIGSVILGLITTVVLIITFFKQEEAGEAQNIKNEIEFLLELYKQMEKDYANIYQTIHFEESRLVKHYRGQEAINMFVNDYVYGDYPIDFTEYGEAFEAVQLDGILRSYDLIKSRIRVLTYTSTLQTLDAKLNIFYSSKLEYVCTSFTNAFKENNTTLDSKAEYLVKFHETYND